MDNSDDILPIGHLDDNQELQEVAGQQTIEALVEIHSKQLKRQFEGDDFKSKFGTSQDADKTLTFAIIDVECEKGMRIALDDDFTSDFDEYVLGLDAKEFSMKSSYMYSDVLNKFRQEKQWDEDKDIMLELSRRQWIKESGEPYPLMQHLTAYDQGISLNFEVIYFNKKTHCLEPLIEPYLMKFSYAQASPLRQLETCISSE